MQERLLGCKQLTCEQWELPGLDWRGEALALYRSPAAITLTPFFDVEDDVLSILHKVLFKPKFHSPQHSPSNQLPPLAIPRRKY